MTRVLLVDDHRLMRESLEKALTAMEGLTVVGSVGSGAEALASVGTLNPDLIIMDIAMPVMNGIDALAQLRKSPGPRIPVLILTMHTSGEFVRSALEHGAMGVVSKDAPLSQLYEAVACARSGRLYIGAEAAVALYGNPGASAQDGPRNSFGRLTPRERSVLQLIAQGLNTKEIARELGISDKTVHGFRTKIMTKLGVNTVVGLTKFALRLGMASLDPAT